MTNILKRPHIMQSLLEEFFLHGNGKLFLIENFNKALVRMQVL